MPGVTAAVLDRGAALAMHRAEAAVRGPGDLCPGRESIDLLSLLTHLRVEVPGETRVDPMSGRRV
jgi:hypothetical protein